MRTAAALLNDLFLYLATMPSGLPLVLGALLWTIAATRNHSRLAPLGVER